MSFHVVTSSVREEIIISVKVINKVKVTTRSSHFKIKLQVIDFLSASGRWDFD